MQFDIKQIQKDFNNIITETQGILNPKTNQLFEEWIVAKKHFIEHMDGKLILEIPNVTFELDSEEKERMVQDFMDWVLCYLNNEELYHFLSKEIDGFFVNKVVQEYSYTPEKTIPKGMKLVKAFKYFEDNPEILEMVQNRASMIIQENIVSGTLCFSVHPLDYLTLSVNSYNWRSCHALDGEYRAGNLSYMVDRSTLICYLKGKDKIYYPGVEWNSKKWRMLLYFSEYSNVVYAGRPYPFSSPNALNIIRETLFDKKLLHNNPHYAWSKWSDDCIDKFYHKETDSYVRISNHICINYKLYNVEDIVVDRRGSRQFNDVVHSSCYKPFYMYDRWTDDPIMTYVGGPVECLRCGKELISTPDTMMCPHCECEYGDSEDETYVTCDCCGRRFVVYNAVWTSDGSRICQQCREQECDVCSECKQLIYKSELTLNRDNNKPICKHCKEKIKYGEG